MNIKRKEKLDNNQHVCLTRLGRRLDLALAGVALGRDTGKWVGLGLDQLLVGSLLPLAVHCRGRTAGEQAHGAEDEQRRADANGSVEGDLLALAGRGLGAGAVGAEGDPVGCLLACGRYSIGMRGIM